MTTRSRYTAAITDKPWWLAGGIPQSACVAAYQPVGASDYAASKVNLNNPGIENATDGVAYPTWSAVNGWMFNRNSSQYLITAYHKVDQTVIVRFSDATGGSGMPLFGVEDRFEFWPVSGSGYGYRGGGDVTITGEGAFLSGVVALNRNSGYRDGILKTTALTGNTAIWRIAIGGRSRAADGSSAGFFSSSYIKAFAIYDTKLTDTQIVALTNAMNAL